MRGQRLLRLALAIAAVFVIAAIDVTYTRSRVPDVPPLCVPEGDPICNAARNAQFEPRIDRITQLEDGLAGRLWIYALAQVTAILIAVRAMLRDDPREKWRSGFADLGALGVVLGLATLFLGTNGFGYESVSVPFDAAAAPTVVALLLAALGGVYSRLGLPAAPSDARTATAGSNLPAGEAAARPRPQLGPVVFGLPLPALAAMGFTILTVVLATIYGDSHTGSCGGGEPVTTPGWAETVKDIAGASAVGAWVFGLVSLLMRRWFVALTSFVVPAVLVFLMALGTCAFY